MGKRGVDYRDVMIGAAADVQAVMHEFQQEIALPQVVSEMAKVWSQMPDEMREKFAKDRPQEYAAFMEMLKG